MATILDYLDPDFPLFPIEDVYHFAKRKAAQDLARRNYLKTVWAMQRSGYLKVVEKNGQQFIKITDEGQLAQLLEKAQVDKPDRWDGKWRVMVFDIPENSHDKRDKFRWLLKRNNFVKLQASVFISPYPLNRAAVSYLEETGLQNFIRIMKVEEMDNDKELKKKFGLLNSRPGK